MSSQIGIKFLRTLDHGRSLSKVAWSGDGYSLLTASGGGTIRVWDARVGTSKDVCEFPQGTVLSLASEPISGRIAAACFDRRVRLWSADGEPIGEFSGDEGSESPVITSVCFTDAYQLVAGATDGTLRVWNVDSQQTVDHVALGHSINGLSYHSAGRILAAATAAGQFSLLSVSPNGSVFAVGLEDRMSAIRTTRRDAATAIAIDPAGECVATAHSDATVRMWSLRDTREHTLIRTLEGHTGGISSLSFSADGRFLASRGYGPNDSTTRIWRTDTGACVAVVAKSASEDWTATALFSPRYAVLASTGSMTHASHSAATDSDTGNDATLHNDNDDRSKYDNAVYLFEIDPAILSGSSAQGAVTYTTAKIVLVGDSGVGKTGLGWRLAHGHFKEHASTHGQQFWLLDELSGERADGARCETIVWDLAGQPDYRLVHALFWTMPTLL